MKKFIALILAFSTLSLPVYADDSSDSLSREQIISEAKQICNIDETYTDFEINKTTEKYGKTLYRCTWNTDDDEKSISLTIGDDGILYSYDKDTATDINKETIYSPDEAVKTADKFLKAALKSKYETIEYKRCSNNYNNTTYVFSYSMLENNVSYLDTSLTIDVNKYTNEITSYSYPTILLGLEIGSFENAKQLTEADDTFKNSIQLGYTADYDYDTDTYEVKMLYRFKDYVIKASDLSPITYDDLNMSAKDSGEYAGMGGGGISELTQEEINEIIGLNNAISAEKALNIFNTTFNRALTIDDVNINYSKEHSTDSYTIKLMTKNAENYTSCSIDSEGRVVSYFTNYKDTNENTSNVSEETLYNAAKALMDKFHYGYKTTDLELDRRFSSASRYEFNSNIIRNGYISYDENINICVDNLGRITSMYAEYLPDSIFNSQTINITPEQAYSIAKDKYPLKPYYLINYIYDSSSEISGEAIAVYGFETDFSIDADTGELLTYYGSKITDRSIKYYTDLNDQWYADYASKLAYMGYYFDSDTFDGDSPLTYGALKELNNSSLYGSLNIDDKEPDDKMTRYEFAEYLVDSLKIKNVNKYNEIYIKPFDDVSYQYTGTIAILKAMGVVNGESFRGNDTITRGEAVTMLYRTLTVL